MCKLEECSISNTIGTAAEIRDTAQVRPSYPTVVRGSDDYLHPCPSQVSACPSHGPDSTGGAVCRCAVCVSRHCVQMTIVGCKVTHNVVVFSAGFPNEVPVMASRKCSLFVHAQNFVACVRYTCSEVRNSRAGDPRGQQEFSAPEP